MTTILDIHAGFLDAKDDIARNEQDFMDDFVIPPKLNIDKRVKESAPDADTVYVKPEENRAYWTGGGKMGYVVLWE